MKNLTESLVFFCILCYIHRERYSFYETASDDNVLSRKAFLLAREGDSMNVGIIGSGRVGYSMGRYLRDHRVDVTGYYDRHPERAADAADFTGTGSFQTMEDLVNASDTLFITTTDAEIAQVWDCIRMLSITDKIICHFSGSLSSVVFQGIEDTGASCVSIHPMLAFSDKYSSYRQLDHAFLTIEGMPEAVATMSELFSSLGNTICQIDAKDKGLYHAAASVLSNQVVAVLDSGYHMLMQCGFTEQEARAATGSLVSGNVKHVVAQGCVAALTGPIERGDTDTVIKHLLAIPQEDYEMYRILGRKLVGIAQMKNPQRDYEKLYQILEEAENKEAFYEKYGCDI